MNGNDDSFDVMLFHQLANLTRYHAERSLEKLGLKPGQVGILFLLHREDGQSGRQLAKKVGITPPSMTEALKKMESMGYVIKRTDPRDQRLIRNYLTEKGEGCIDQLKEILNEIEELVFRGFSWEERVLMRRFLLNMRDNLTDMKEFRGMNVCDIMKKTKPDKMPPPPFE